MRAGGRLLRFACSRSVQATSSSLFNGVRFASLAQPQVVSSSTAIVSGSSSGSSSDSSSDSSVSDSSSSIGYDAWWRSWQEHRQQLPRVTVDDILASEEVVVLDGNIGSIFVKMAVDNPSPDRQVFLGMLMSLFQCGRLNAPPKLMHKYSVSTNGAITVLIPATKMEEGDRRIIGEMSHRLMDWIVEAKYELPRDPTKTLEFLVTLLQCAFLYKSTIILTNNKDFYFLTKIAKEMGQWIGRFYPSYAVKISLESIRIVFVLEQLKLDVHRVVRYA